MSEPLRALLLTLLVVLGSLGLSLVVALVVMRGTGQLLARLAARRSGELRRLILTALLGGPEESATAVGVLRARKGRAWDRVEQQAFAMLPKIKGDSHQALVTLLLERGAAGRAFRNARARSLVRRSRGAYQLGALGDRRAVEVLLRLLTDDHFLVRRTAVRALGQVGDARAVRGLLDAVTADPALTRDVVAALQRIGSDASPDLRRDLVDEICSEHSGRRGPLVATVLGLHGDLASVPALTEAVTRGLEPALRAAAAAALGEIGMPSAVPALVRALDADTSPAVRREAAVALGKISDTAAVPALSLALGTGSHLVERAVAAALLRMGSDGLDVLEQHPSPYAAEALAVHRMRVRA